MSRSQELHRLGALNNVRSIGWLSLVNLPALDSLAGLGQLKEVDLFELAEVPILSTVDGLTSIKRVTQLLMWALPKLTNLRGLSSLEHPIQRAMLEDLIALDSLDGLKFDAPTHELFLVNLPVLKHVEPLTQVSKIDDLTLISIGTAGMTGNLSELRGLARVKNSMVLHDIDGLLSLDGLGALQSAGKVMLTSLPNIDHLAGLDKLHVAEAIALANCPSLLVSMPKYFVSKVKW